MSSLEQSAPRIEPDVHGSRTSSWGFGSGLICGTALMLVALYAADSQPLALEQGIAFAEAAQHSAGVWSWIVLNLGHSFWFFVIVLGLYVLNVTQLHGLLRSDPHSLRVTKLDQLSDVWMHLFVGIGVIWTAVGMRSALQAALGDTSALTTPPELESADAVLRKLVDGGILLALTTTIVGGIGGYLMRLVKTVVLGSRLQALFDQQQRSDVQALLAATQRIESRMTWQADEALDASGPGDVRAPA